MLEEFIVQEFLSFKMYSLQKLVCKATNLLHDLETSFLKRMREIDSLWELEYNESLLSAFQREGEDPSQQNPATQNPYVNSWVLNYLYKTNHHDFMVFSQKWIYFLVWMGTWIE